MSLKTTWVSEGRCRGFNYQIGSTIPTFLSACYYGQDDRGITKQDKPSGRWGQL